VKGPVAVVSSTERLAVNKHKHFVEWESDSGETREKNSPFVAEVAAVRGLSRVDASGEVVLLYCVLPAMAFV
jgi:hypothetical protein